MAGRLHDGFVPGRHAIDAVGGGGFRFAEMSHRGSILALPSGVRAWQPSTPLALEDFAPALAERDAIDHLLLGTGPNLAPLAVSLRAALKEQGLARVEPMATVHAAQTYNLLLAEGRRVAAALVALS